VNSYEAEFLGQLKCLIHYRIHACFFKTVLFE